MAITARCPFFVLDEGEDLATRQEVYHREISDKSRDAFDAKLAPELDRCLRISGSFEGPGYSAISGDFDGQGGSLGILQWCFGQGSVQPMLKEMVTNHRDALSRVWTEAAIDELQNILLNADKARQTAWASSKLGSRETPTGYWADLFRRMLTTPEYIAIQQEYAQSIFLRAVATADSFHLKQKNGLALCFDIMVQNGSIADKHRARISDMMAKMSHDLCRPLTEDEQLECIARGRAAFSLARWQPDVASRKLCVAHRKSLPFTWDGTHYSGWVHGENRDLEKQFNLTTAPFRTP